jgi:hypothetical protein
MTHLLWGLLNIGIFLFFISVCINATKLLRREIGLFAAVIFVFGLLSFVAGSNDKSDNLEPNSNQTKTWKFVSADSLKSSNTYFHEIDLEKTWFTKYELGIIYGKEQQKNIPINAYSSVTGFLSGTNWKPISIIVNRTDNNNRFEYAVDGVVEWNLLGLTIFSQMKEFRGIISIKR